MQARETGDGSPRAVASRMRTHSPIGSAEDQNFESERGTNERRKQRGWSLMELLIVVAIILIIAAIAIPNLLRARIAANESSAVRSIRTIVSGEGTQPLASPTGG